MPSPDRPATEKQVTLLRRLYKKHRLDVDPLDALDPDALTVRQASRLIDELLPKRS